MSEPIRSLWVPGRPIPKPRPRLSKAGNFYTPDTGYEDIVAGRWLEKFGRSPLTGPVRLTMCFSFEKGNEGCFIQVAQEAPEVGYRMARPDLDNLIKATDSLTGLAWQDDAQIVAIDAWKVNKMQEEKPCLKPDTW